MFSLALNFDSNGPQSGLWGNRFNPIHTMLATGTDAVAGRQESIKVRYADDMVTMPLQCGTQWDALGHVFYGDKMWNGYDARLVDSNGAQKNGIEKVEGQNGRPRRASGCGPVQGRGFARRRLRHRHRRTGKMRRRPGRGSPQRRFRHRPHGAHGALLEGGSWEGYAGGNAPGLRFETADWIRRTDIAAICADTWGCEVRPNETDIASQPWHWVVIPMIGISMGEIFYLKDLAEDCAADHVYEFFFCAPPLPITKAVGSPVNPIAIK